MSEASIAAAAATRAMNPASKPSGVDASAPAAAANAFSAAGRRTHGASAASLAEKAPGSAAAEAPGREARDAAASGIEVRCPRQAASASATWDDFAPGRETRRWWRTRLSDAGAVGRCMRDHPVTGGGPPITPSPGMTGSAENGTRAV